MRTMRVMLAYVSVCLFVLLLPLRADERNADEAMKAATGQSEDEQQPVRPAKMPDLTKGDPLPAPGKDGDVLWNMGPTGIVGIKNTGNAGDQVRVISVIPGSPADGKVLPGDVLLGVAGQNFIAGGDINRVAGDAIIQAEEEAGKGLLDLHVWRDRNWAKRTGAKDMLGVDLDKLFKEAEEGESFYEWKEQKARSAELKKASTDNYPIDGFKTNMTLHLRVIGTYSETSPWDCPVVKKVREEAWKVLAADFTPDKRGKRHGDWPGAIALVASGKPEYRELVRSWVRSLKLETNMNARVTLDSMTYRGMQSWAAGFEGLEQAIYYDATGDDYVLPEVRKRAIWTALGQSAGGSWGHTFSFPEVNGGILHGRCPGYGGMNNAGGRCFFLLSLARKSGIKDPEIDAAIARASRFFRTYVDKGCIPYGDHAPWPSDDSNGKNYGVAYAFYLLDQKYEAQFFSMHSANAAFSRRGGHGSPTLWYYTPLCANIAGPAAVQASMRNMRYFYTLSRRHDGSFVFLGEQGPGIGGKGMRNPTATVAMHLSAPLKQLIITGKDADQKFWMNDEEIKDLLVSARGQINDPKLLEKAGKPWNERGTDELIALLDHFYPVIRRGIAQELGKRYAAGEKDIAAKVLPLLKSDAARAREGACLTLAACGADSVLASLSGITTLLSDKAEFVRMTAISTIAGATKSGESKREELLLKAAAEGYPGMSSDIANAAAVVKAALFSSDKKKGADPASKLSSSPFEAGYDKELVRTALEKIITLDPGGVALPTWSRDTLVELAGPIVFISDELQMMDKMFGGDRLVKGRALLAKYGYREAVECDVVNLLKRSQLERGVRQNVIFAHGGASILYGILNPLAVDSRPGAYRNFLAPMKQWLQDDPLAEPTGMGADWIPRSTGLNVLISKIEADKKSYELASLESEVAAVFEKELAAKGDAAGKATFCRNVLKNPADKHFFHKMAALTQLAALVGPEAIKDVAPYLGDEQWRLREHAYKVALGLVKGGAGERLVACLVSANGETAVAMLMLLKEAGVKSALEPARNMLKHKDGVVRKAAVETVYALGGDKMLPDVFTFLAGAEDAQELWGCELALLSRKEDAAVAQHVRDQALALMPKASVAQRRSLAYVLGQLGGAESLAALQKAAATTSDDVDLKNIIEALSYSPDRSVDKVMLALAKQDKRLLEAVAAQSVRRMVGPNGVSDVTDAQRMDFAEPMLKMKQDAKLITYLGKVHTGRSVTTLYEAMKTGSAPVASRAIISAADGMEESPEEERKLAAEALAGVIEYIEVKYLRGGLSAHMSKDDDYLGWKALQAQAGKAMLKVHKPKAAAIPSFDNKELDL